VDVVPQGGRAELPDQINLGGVPRQPALIPEELPGEDVIAPVEVGPGRRRHELHGQPAAARAEMGAGRRRRERHRPAVVPEDEIAPVEMGGHALPPHLAELGARSPRVGSIRSVGSLLRQEAQEREVAALQQQLAESRQREAAAETARQQLAQQEADLQRRLAEVGQREAAAREAERIRAAQVSSPTHVSTYTPAASSSSTRTYPPEFSQEHQDFLRPRDDAYDAAIRRGEPSYFAHIHERLVSFPDEAPSTIQAFNIAIESRIRQAMEEGANATEVTARWARNSFPFNQAYEAGIRRGSSAYQAIVSGYNAMG
jgi:hypothetical protein